jgi:ketosteroid isomerase-like protein
MHSGEQRRPSDVRGHCANASEYRMGRGDTAIVRQAFAAFAARDLEALEMLSSVSLVLTHSPTGSALGQQLYEGRSGLARYLSDVERVWDRLELRPETFHNPRPGEVLVKGSVIARRGGASQQVPAAWSWTIVVAKIASVRVLPTAAA